MKQESIERVPSKAIRRTVVPSLLPILLLAALPSLLYVILGYGGHDFSFHAASWLELHRAWSHHEWRLGWAQWAQYGFGEPRFCFYPPLSLMVGAGLSFLLPFRFVPGVVVWLVLSLAGLSMYKASGLFLDKQQRLTAAILYMFNPYLLLTVVLRYAIAEAWLQALLPLIFLYFYLSVVEWRLREGLVCAVLLAVGWLTNIPEAIGIFYALVVVALVVSMQLRSFWPALLAAWIQGVSLLLAGFRLVPAIEERAWITSQSLLKYDFRFYMQLKKIPPPHLLVFLCGVYIALALALLLPAASEIYRRERKWRTPVLALLSLASFAVLLQLPLSTPVWERLPQLKYVLFPYRLLPLLSLALVFLLLTDGVARRLRRAGFVALALFALVPFPCFTRLFTFQRFHSMATATAEWQAGFEGVGEYVPVGVAIEHFDAPAERVLRKEGLFHGAACGPVMVSADPNERLVETSSAEPCRLVLNSFYYPFWHARLENGAGLSMGKDGDGRMSVDVPAGTHTVRFAFVPASAGRTLSAIGSAVVWLVVLTGLVVLGRLEKTAIVWRPGLIRAKVAAGARQTGTAHDGGELSKAKEAS